MSQAISVIVPVFNAEKTLEYCVDSILAQTFQSFELILVDDGSTDSSAAMCDSLAASDSRISVIHKKNGGVSSARNAGIDSAVNEWITFVDSDDSMPADALQKLTDALADENSAWLVLGGFSVCGEDGQSYSTEIPGADKYYNSAASFFDGVYRKDKSFLRAPWGKLYRKTDLRFNESLRYGEDLLFITLHIANAPSDAGFAVVNASVYNYFFDFNGLGGDLVSDRHIEQLFELIPLYADAINSLLQRIPDSVKAQQLYHDDLVGRFCCRILTAFATYRTALLSKDNISKLYSCMSEDKSLTLNSLRRGQIPNILLCKLGCPSLTVVAYKLTRLLPFRKAKHNPYI